jgi:hypothetical protein
MTAEAVAHVPGDEPFAAALGRSVVHSEPLLD